MKIGRPRFRSIREEKIAHLARRLFENGKRLKQIAGDRNAEIDFSFEQADKLQRINDMSNLLIRRILTLTARETK